MRGIGRSLFLAGAAWLTSCASPMSVGERYKQQGSDELAAYYFASHIDTKGADERAPVALRESVERVARSLVAEAESQTPSGKNLAKLYRVAMLIGLAREYEVPAPSEKQLVEPIKKNHHAVASQALAALDKSESAADAGTKGQLGVLERAVAWIADDAELSSRYRLLRDRLTKRVRLTGECTAQPRSCESLVAGVRQHLMSRRETLIAVVDDGDASVDFEVRLSFSFKVDQGEWEVERKGKGEAKVSRYDKYNEQVRDDKGDPVKDKVEATYVVKRRSASASINVPVSLFNTRTNAKVSSTTKEKTASNERRFLEWQGDERAVADLISQFGTDRSAPKDTQQLTHDALAEVSAEVAAWVRTSLDE